MSAKHYILWYILEKSKSELGFSNMASILNYHIASLEVTLPLLQMEQTVLWADSHQELLQLR